MPGATEITGGAVLLLGVIASVTDIARGRIFNWLTAPMTLVALIFAFSTHGFSGLAHSLLGIGLGLLLYGWMFWIGILGGGDVKLLMAFGAWGGVQYVRDVAFMGLVLGGIMAFLMLLFHGHLIAFLRKLYRFFLSLMVRELEIETIQVNRKLTMPFGVPISVAAIWVQWGHPLQLLGVHL
jgi:prepilin peptidase CpaA